jgi:hypothetical protein
MTKKIYYEKVGRRYKPVYEYDQTLMDSFSKGTHLVDVYPGGSSRRYNIDPAYAPMIAAGRVAEDAISKHLMEVSKLRVSSRERPLTEEQRAAWHALSKAMGKELYPLEYCSYREAAEEGVKAMMQEVEKLLENPTVRKAYERFLFVAELTKEHNGKSTL